MNFVSNRDIVVRSVKTGHSIEFKKGVATQVPPQMHSEVMEKGILPVEADGTPVDPAKNEASKAPSDISMPPVDAYERDGKILEVIRAIVKRNNSGDFVGGGHPAAHAITASLGWRVDQKEVKKVWEANREELLRQKAA